MPAVVEICGDRLCVSIEEVGIWTVICLLSEESAQTLLAATMERLPGLAPGFAAPEAFVPPAPEPDLQQPLQQRQRVLNAAWTAIESARPTVGDVDWAALRYCIMFPASPIVGFYCDGDQDLAHARFWGRAGCHVSACWAAVSDGGLAVRVELSGNDHMGEYGYMIAFRLGDTSFYAMLYPDRKIANLAIDRAGEWIDLGSVQGRLVQIADRTMSALFSNDLFTAVFAPEELLTSVVDLHIDYSENGRRELFFFPGTGKAVRLP